MRATLDRIVDGRCVTNVALARVLYNKPSLLIIFDKRRLEVRSLDLNLEFCQTFTEDILDIKVLGTPPQQWCKKFDDSLVETDPSYNNTFCKQREALLLQLDGPVLSIIYYHPLLVSFVEIIRNSFINNKILSLNKPIILSKLTTYPKSGSYTCFLHGSKEAPVIGKPFDGIGPMVICEKSTESIFEAQRYGVIDMVVIAEMGSTLVLAMLTKAMEGVKCIVISVNIIYNCVTVLTELPLLPKSSRKIIAMPSVKMKYNDDPDHYTGTLLNLLILCQGGVIRVNKSKVYWHPLLGSVKTISGLEEGGPIGTRHVGAVAVNLPTSIFCTLANTIIFSLRGELVSYEDGKFPMLVGLDNFSDDSILYMESYQNYAVVKYESGRIATFYAKGRGNIMIEKEGYKVVGNYNGQSLIRTRYKLPLEYVNNTNNMQYADESNSNINCQRRRDITIKLQSMRSILDRNEQESYDDFKFADDKNKSGKKKNTKSELVKKVTNNIDNNIDMNLEKSTKIASKKKKESVKISTLKKKVDLTMETENNNHQPNTDVISPSSLKKKKKITNTSITTEKSKKNNSSNKSVEKKLNDIDLIFNQENILENEDIVDDHMSLMTNIKIESNESEANMKNMDPKCPNMYNKNYQTKDYISLQGLSESNIDTYPSKIEMINNMQNTEILNNDSEILNNGSEILNNDSEILNNDSEILNNSEIFNSEILNNDSEILNNDSAILNNNSEIFNSEILNNDSEILNNDSAILNNNSEILNNSEIFNSEILNNDSEILNNDSEILNNNSELLNSEILNNDSEMFNIDSEILNNNSELLNSEILNNDSEMFNIDSALYKDEIHEGLFQDNLTETHTDSTNLSNSHKNIAEDTSKIDNNPNYLNTQNMRNSCNLLDKLSTDQKKQYNIINNDYKQAYDINTNIPFETSDYNSTTNLNTTNNIYTPQTILKKSIKKLEKIHVDKGWIIPIAEKQWLPHISSASCIDSWLALSGGSNINILCNRAKVENIVSGNVVGVVENRLVILEKNVLHEFDITKGPKDLSSNNNKSKKLCNWPELTNYNSNINNIRAILGCNKLRVILGSSHVQLSIVNNINIKPNSELEKNLLVVKSNNKSTCLFSPVYTSKKRGARKARDAKRQKNDISFAESSDTILIQEKKNYTMQSKNHLIQHDNSQYLYMGLQNLKNNKKIDDHLNFASNSKILNTTEVKNDNNYNKILPLYINNTHYTITENSNVIVSGPLFLIEEKDKILLLSVPTKESVTGPALELVGHKVVFDDNNTYLVEFHSSISAYFEQICPNGYIKSISTSVNDLDFIMAVAFDCFGIIRRYSLLGFLSGQSMWIKLLTPMDALHLYPSRPGFPGLISPNGGLPGEMVETDDYEIEPINNYFDTLSEDSIDTSRYENSIEEQDIIDDKYYNEAPWLESEYIYMNTKQSESDILESGHEIYEVDGKDKDEVDILRELRECKKSNIDFTLPKDDLNNTLEYRDELKNSNNDSYTEKDHVLKKEIESKFRDNCTETKDNELNKEREIKFTSDTNYIETSIQDKVISKSSYNIAESKSNDIINECQWKSAELSNLAIDKLDETVKDILYEEDNSLNNSDRLYFASNPDNSQILTTNTVKRLAQSLDDLENYDNNQYSNNSSIENFTQKIIDAVSKEKFYRTWAGKIINYKNKKIDGKLVSGVPLMYNQGILKRDTYINGAIRGLSLISGDLTEKLYSEYDSQYLHTRDWSMLTSIPLRIKVITGWDEGPIIGVTREERLVKYRVMNNGSIYIDGCIDSSMKKSEKYSSQNESINEKINRDEIVEQVPLDQDFTVNNTVTKSELYSSEIISNTDQNNNQIAFAEDSPEIQDIKKSEALIITQGWCFPVHDRQLLLTGAQPLTCQGKYIGHLIANNLELFVFQDGAKIIVYNSRNICGPQHDFAKSLIQIAVGSDGYTHPKVKNSSLHVHNDNIIVVSNILSREWRSISFNDTEEVLQGNQSELTSVEVRDINQYKRSKGITRIKNEPIQRNWKNKRNMTNRNDWEKNKTIKEETSNTSNQNEFSHNNESFADGFNSEPYNKTKQSEILYLSPYNNELNNCSGQALSKISIIKNSRRKKSIKLNTASQSFNFAEYTGSHMNNIDQIKGSWIQQESIQSFQPFENKQSNFLPPIDSTVTRQTLNDLTNKTTQNLLSNTLSMHNNPFLQGNPNPTSSNSLTDNIPINLNNYQSYDIPDNITYNSQQYQNANIDILSTNQYYSNYKENINTTDNITDNSKINSQHVDFQSNNILNNYNIKNNFTSLENNIYDNNLVHFSKGQDSQHNLENLEHRIQDISEKNLSMKKSIPEKNNSERNTNIINYLSEFNNKINYNQSTPFTLNLNNQISTEFQNNLKYTKDLCNLSNSTLSDYNNGSINLSDLLYNQENYGHNFTEETINHHLREINEFNSKISFDNKNTLESHYMNKTSDNQRLNNQLLGLKSQNSDNQTNNMDFNLLPKFSIPNLSQDYNINPVVTNLNQNNTNIYSNLRTNNFNNDGFNSVTSNYQENFTIPLQSQNNQNSSHTNIPNSTYQNKDFISEFNTEQNVGTINNYFLNSNIKSTEVNQDLISQDCNRFLIQNENNSNLLILPNINTNQTDINGNYSLYSMKEASNTLLSTSYKNPNLSCYVPDISQTFNSSNDSISKNSNSYNYIPTGITSNSINDIQNLSIKNVSHSKEENNSQIQDIITHNKENKYLDQNHNIKEYKNCLLNNQVDIQKHELRSNSELLPKVEVLEQMNYDENSSLNNNNYLNNSQAQFLEGKNIITSQNDTSIDISQIIDQYSDVKNVNIISENNQLLVSNTESNYNNIDTMNHGDISINNNQTLFLNNDLSITNDSINSINRYDNINLTTETLLENNIDQNKLNTQSFSNILYNQEQRNNSYVNNLKIYTDSNPLTSVPTNFYDNSIVQLNSGILNNMSYPINEIKIPNFQPENNSENIELNNMKNLQNSFYLGNKNLNITPDSDSTNTNNNVNNLGTSQLEFSNDNFSTINTKLINPEKLPDLQKQFNSDTSNSIELKLNKSLNNIISNSVSIPNSHQTSDILISNSNTQYPLQKDINHINNLDIVNVQSNTINNKFYSNNETQNIINCDSMILESYMKSNFSNIESNQQNKQIHIETHNLNNINLSNLTSDYIDHNMNRISNNPINYDKVKELNYNEYSDTEESNNESIFEKLDDPEYLLNTLESICNMPSARYVERELIEFTNLDEHGDCIIRSQVLLPIHESCLCTSTISVDNQVIVVAGTSCTNSSDGRLLIFSCNTNNWECVGRREFKNPVTAVLLTQSPINKFIRLIYCSGVNLVIELFDNTTLYTVPFLTSLSVQWVRSLFIVHNYLVAGDYITGPHVFHLPNSLTSEKRAAGVLFQARTKVHFANDNIFDFRNNQYINTNQYLKLSTIQKHFSYSHTLKSLKIKKLTNKVSQDTVIDQTILPPIQELRYRKINYFRTLLHDINNKKTYSKIYSRNNGTFVNKNPHIKSFFKYTNINNLNFADNSSYLYTSNTRYNKKIKSINGPITDINFKFKSRSVVSARVDDVRTVAKALIAQSDELRCHSVIPLAHGSCLFLVTLHDGHAVSIYQVQGADISATENNRPGSVLGDNSGSIIKLSKWEACNQLKWTSKIGCNGFALQGKEGIEIIGEWGSLYRVTIEEETEESDVILTTQALIPPILIGSKSKSWKSPPFILAYIRRVRDMMDLRLINWINFLTRHN